MTTPTIEKNDVIPEQLPTNREELIALMRNVYQEEQKAAGKKVLSMKEIKDAFKALPGEEYREYELAVARFARDWADFIIKKEKKKDKDKDKDQGTDKEKEEEEKDDGPEPLIRQLLPKKGEQLQYGTEEEKIAFAAFAVAVNYERLHKNRIEEGKLLAKYREHFGKKHQVEFAPEQYEHVFFFHLDVLYRMDLAVDNNDDDFLMDLLRDSKINSINLTKNHGGHHAFAETTALAFENAKPHLREQLANAPEHWLEAAKISVNNAILHDPDYAKFYCTYGRVLALCGDLEGAIKNINQAIALEKSTRTDYSIRIGQYSSYDQQFRAQQKLRNQQETMAKMEATMAEQMEEMKLAMEAQEKESMAKNMEFLGLFSGIVSFTIGSLTITGAIAEQSIKHAAGLIVVLLGALMCVFAAFGMILHGFHAVRRNKKTQKFERSFIYRHLVVFILGAAVVLGGIYFCLS